jgi:hypothetical protein
MKLQTSATLFVALSLVSLACSFNLPVLAQDKVDGPSVEDLKNPKSADSLSNNLLMCARLWTNPQKLKPR